MRRYAMTMTMSAVSVAVLLLGLPLGGRLDRQRVALGRER